MNTMENEESISGECTNEEYIKIPASPLQKIDIPTKIDDLGELYKYVNALQITVNRNIDNYIEVWKMLNDISCNLTLALSTLMR